MAGPEAIAALLSIAFTGAVLIYLRHRVREIPRSFADPELAAYARRTAPYHHLARVMSQRGTPAG